MSENGERDGGVSDTFQGERGHDAHDESHAIHLQADGLAGRAAAPPGHRQGTGGGVVRAPAGDDFEKTFKSVLRSM